MNELNRKDPPKEPIKVKYCAKCKNHGRKEEMKGHKRECARRLCSCDKCQGTEKKRAKTRVQVQLRRTKLLQMEKAAKGKDLNQQHLLEEDGHNETATERVREAEGFAQDQCKLKRKPELQLEETSSPWKKTRIDKKANRTWEAVLALCEDFRERIEQATKEVAEKIIQENRTEEVPAPVHQHPWLGPHYHPLPPIGPELPGSIYKLPPAFYPRPVPFSFSPFPHMREAPYGFAHGVPPATYTIPCHEPARPSVLSYDDFQKLENKRTSPCSHRSEDPSPFQQVEI